MGQVRNRSKDPGDGLRASETAKSSVVRSYKQERTKQKVRSGRLAGANPKGA